MFTVVAYHKETRDGSVAMYEFETLDELLYHIRGFDFVDKYGRQQNKFLDSTICSENDAFKTGSEYYYSNGEIYSRPISYLYGYLTYDSDGRVIDFRNRKDELYSFDYKAYSNMRYAARRDSIQAKYNARDAMWEKKNRLYEGEKYWRYYRRIRTTQERRYAADAEHKPHVRCRRNTTNLPDNWDELLFRREKSWKARDKKACRQWGVSIPKHFGTVKASVEAGENEWEDDGT